MRKQIFTMVAALCGLGAVHAADQTAKIADGYAGLKTAIAAASSTGGGIVRVEAGIYYADGLGQLEIKDGVTIRGGYPVGSIDGVIDETVRIYPGAAATNAEMTILDGNSLVNTIVSKKFRVAEVSGTLEGVMIRNGHARENGGGVLVKTTGTVQNCIIKGNVAMNPTSNDALGGGAYLEGGKLINCVVAFNMANNGYGVAGLGDVINNTISANTYAPVAVAVAGNENGTAFRHFVHWRVTDVLPWVSGAFDESDDLDDRELYFTDFSISQTETTTSQYAVFAAAMDLDGANPVAIGNDVKFADATFKLSDLTNPFNGENVGAYMGLSGDAGIALFRESSANSNVNGLRQVGKDFIYYPTYANDAMTFVSWYGALAYSLWIGGTLPTEGQWEYAARNGVAQDKYLYAGGDDLDLFGWVENKGGSRVKEVGTKASNGALELYDMTGNVREWCADFINTTNNPGAYPTIGSGQGTYANATDPICILSSSANRVSRGASWSDPTLGYLTLAYRRDNPPTDMYSTIGFRPLLVP